MGNKSDKRKQQELERQAAEDRRRLNELLAQAAQPKPLETAQETEALKWLRQTSGSEGPLDIKNLSAMKPHLGLYEAASQRQSSDRMGQGLLQMGASNSNPMLGQLLRSQSEDVRQQQAAGGLENAYRLTDAQMRGNIMPLLGLQQNRSMGLAGMASGNSQNSTQAWANFRPAPSFWQNLLMAGVSGGAQVGAAFMGRP
jgi:hypothetical protein